MINIEPNFKKWDKELVEQQVQSLKNQNVPDELINELTGSSGVGGLTQLKIATNFKKNVMKLHEISITITENIESLYQKGFVDDIQNNIIKSSYLTFWSNPDNIQSILESFYEDYTGSNYSTHLHELEKGIFVASGNTEHFSNSLMTLTPECVDPYWINNIIKEFIVRCEEPGFNIPDPKLFRLNYGSHGYNGMNLPECLRE